MSRLTIRTRPTITMPGFTIPPGITIRPELVLRTARRDRRDRRRRRVQARLVELLARAERPTRRPDPRIAERLVELLSRAERPARRPDSRISRLLALRPAIRPAPVEPVRPARDPRIPVIVVLFVGVSAVALLVAVIVRRRAASGADAARIEEPTGAAAGVVAAPPPAPAAPAWLRRFVTHRFNPAVVRLGLVGGRRSPWGYLEHVGRTTGMVYRTPVLPRIAGEYACVPLTYGMDVSWARNVRAAGHCRLQVRGTVYELDEPAVITAAEHPDLPEAFRGRLIRRGNRYLRLHVLSATPGSLDTVAQPAEPVPPVEMVPVPEPEAAARAADTPSGEPG